MTDPIDIDAYIEKAQNHLAILTQSHKETWHLGSSDRWDADQESGIITWTFLDGTTVKASFQIIGTYSLESGTFLWGWDHPSVLEELRQDAKAVLKFGAENDVQFLQWRMLECSEEDAWKLVALATLLNDRQGAYRGPAGDTLVFMTFDEVSISKKP